MSKTGCLMAFIMPKKIGNSFVKRICPKGINIVLMGALMVEKQGQKSRQISLYLVLFSGFFGWHFFWPFSEPWH
ncbi:MAG TPA: hypothetical protein VK970_19410 [Candidatus Methylacidiphilales bacterium]|nr:hypothetical protein [Candidatus Methylacidiphilales bacterium]